MLRAMRIALTRLTDERHRLSVTRDDGTGESCELETRSFLLHDLIHYAVEAEAPIADGFWGLLHQGRTLAELGDRERVGPYSRGAALAETLTGPMQAVWNGRMTTDRFLELAPRETGLTIDAAFVERASARLRGLTGAWRATPFRGTLDLDWPPGAAPRVRAG